MNVYLIRHGETDWNKDKRLQGQTEVPLNANGIELAKITAMGMKDIKLDYAFSSPLGRAMTTAEVILEGRDINIVKDDRLKEVRFGVYEGVAADKRPPECMLFFEKPEEYRAPSGGESYEQLISRTRSFIEEVLVPLASKEPDCNVLVSGHGAMNKALMLTFMGKELKDIWSGPFQKNCSLSKIVIDNNGFNVLYENKIFY